MASVIQFFSGGTWTPPNDSGDGYRGVSASHVHQPGVEWTCHVYLVKDP